jgi:hypothetical protein
MVRIDMNIIIITVLLVIVGAFVIVFLDMDKIIRRLYDIETNQKETNDILEDIRDTMKDIHSIIDTHIKL